MGGYAPIRSSGSGFLRRGDHGVAGRFAGVGVVKEERVQGAAPEVGVAQAPEGDGTMDARGFMNTAKISPQRCASAD